MNPLLAWAFRCLQPGPHRQHKVQAELCADERSLGQALGNTNVRASGTCINACEPLLAEQMSPLGAAELPQCKSAFHK